LEEETYLLMSKLSKHRKSTPFPSVWEGGGNIYTLYILNHGWEIKIKSKKGEEGRNKEGICLLSDSFGSHRKICKTLYGKKYHIFSSIAISYFLSFASSHEIHKIS